MRVFSYLPLPFEREGWGEGDKIVKLKQIKYFNILRTGQLLRKSCTKNPLGFRIFTRLNLSLLNSCTMCTQTKGGFDTVSSVTITQTCVWVVYFNYTQQHLAYFNTCLFQDLLNNCRKKSTNVTHSQARTIIT